MIMVPTLYLYSLPECQGTPCSKQAPYLKYILATNAKWLSVRFRSKWLWVRIPLLSLKLQTWSPLRARSSLTFRQTIECKFTLKLVRHMIVTYSQMHRTDKYTHHSSITSHHIIRVFVYQLSGCGFESRCCYLNFRYGACFEQGFP